MPPNRSQRKAKCGKSDGKQPLCTVKSIKKRTSPRNRCVKEVRILSRQSPTENSGGVRPKRTRNKSKGRVQFSKPTFSKFRDTPSTSYLRSRRSARSDSTCAFYKVTQGEDGKPIFSKALMRYFMKVDSPEVEDLKKKRFNTSFLRETPRRRDRERDIQIFTPEEDNDPKYFENVPVLDFDMPTIPGSEHAHIFESMPINDSDEEFKQFCHNKKSTRVTAFKAKPLPDQFLTVDYTDVLDSESSNDDLVKHTEVNKRSLSHDDELMNERKNQERGSILFSLLSSTSDMPIRPPYSFFHSSACDDLSRKKEDEIILNKYKDIMGDRQLNVMLTRLPTDALELELSKKKKLKQKSMINLRRRKKISTVKQLRDKRMKISRTGFSNLQNKKCDLAKL